MVKCYKYLLCSKCSQLLNLKLSSQMEVLSLMTDKFLRLHYILKVSIELENFIDLTLLIFSPIFIL